MAELEVAHLSLRFGGLTVLEDVSFSVAAGELFALIGPNGAGKTSALNCISGIYRGSGAIRFRGEDIAARAPHEIARLGLAPVVVQDLTRRLLAVRDELGIAILLVEQSAAAALTIADHAYVMENGRIVLDGDRERLKSHQDVQEFYLGQASGERRSYRAIKQYRRSRRWYG